MATSFTSKAAVCANDFLTSLAVSGEQIESIFHPERQAHSVAGASMKSSGSEESGKPGKANDPDLARHINDFFHPKR